MRRAPLRPTKEFVGLHRHAQADPFAGVALHDAGVAVSAVVVGDVVADGARFPGIHGAALAHRLFLHILRLGYLAVVVLDAVADHGAGNRTGGGRRGAAIAVTDLVAEQGAGDAADDRAAGAALLLLLHRHLDVFGLAFLARLANLFHARLHTDDASEILEFGRLGGGQGAGCGRGQ